MHLKKSLDTFPFLKKTYDSTATGPRWSVQTARTETNSNNRAMMLLPRPHVSRLRPCWEGERKKSALSNLTCIE
jgi:hypothetical protein